MQAYCDRASLCETVQTGLATFWSRSRRERWCKGETSDNYLRVNSVHVDCDGDAVVMTAVPDGPSCHTGARTCWFSRADVVADGMGSLVQRSANDGRGGEGPGPGGSWGSLAPRPTLLALEDEIRARAAAASKPPEEGARPSWTQRLLADPALCCSKVREEADELCRAHEDAEGKVRTASEAADLLYHAMVLMRIEGVDLEDVLAELRGRFGVSGVDEKAARKK